MKTRKYALVVRAVAAAAVVIAGSSLAVPALAEVGPAATATASPSPSVAPTPPTTTAESAAPSPQSGISDAGLAEAVRRDLGMTLEEFNAAGELGRRAADAVPSLSKLPGYVGISLKDGKIVVNGSGAELQARIDQLNATGSPLFELHIPAAVAPSAPASSAAPATAELVASSTEQLFQDYLREVGAAELQAVAYADGRFVIRTGGINMPEAGVPAVVDPVLPVMPPTATNAPLAPVQPGKISPAEFVARYANVQLEKAAPVKTEADVYGGEGYVMDSQYGRTICSTGFGAFSAVGLPVLLTAGHCAEDGKAAIVGLEPATSSPAGGSLPLPGTLPKLGSFGFSQFGGVNNAPVLNPNWTTGDAGEPGNVGTDIAVIEKLDGGVNVQPAVAKWDNVANPAPTSVKIIGALAPVAGQNVCRSGRTTGWKCGTVSELGIYVAGGTSPSAADARAFRGFLSKDVKSSGGDSGGPWISGNYAVGTHTGAESVNGTQVSAIATTLEDALKQIPGGVQLQLFLNKPELAGISSASTALPNSVIHGRVAAAPASAVALNSKVRLAGLNPDAVEIPVDAAGNWSFRAPATQGSFQLTAETVNGYSHSGTTTFSLNVSELVAPTISTPAAGSSIATLDRVEGTGTPGNIVKLSGDAIGSAPVAPDGRWSVPLGTQPVYGKISVSAVQTSPDYVDGPATTAEFTVPPPPPAASSIENGSRFGQDSLPATISGTGVDGAEVSVLIDGVQIGAGRMASGSGAGAKAVAPSLVTQALVADGRWSVPFPAGLAVGPHTLAVSQLVDGVTSLPVEYRFTITPAAAPAAGAAAAPGSATPAPAGAALNPQGSPAVLAYTGAGGVLPIAGVAAGALLLGGVLIAFGRRRRVR